MSASGSRQSMGYVLETVYGTTPASPVFKALRHNSTSLNLAKNTFMSNELRSDRQIADFRHGTRSIGGNVVGELSGGSYDDLLEAALGGAWTANVLKAGLLRKSFTVERHFQDITQYLRYTGVQVDSLQIGATTGAIVSATFGFMGRGMSVGTAPITLSTYPGALTTSPMDALTGVLQEGGVTNAVVTEVSLSLNNNLAARYVIGSADTLEPSIGRSNVTGQMTAFFADVALYNKFITETTSSLSFVASDGAKSYTILLPRIKYTGGDVPVSGEGPVSITMPFQAVYDPTALTNIQITRVP